MYLPNELSPESNLGRISFAIELSKLDKFSHRHKMWFLKNNEIVIESRKNITNSFQIKKGKTVLVFLKNTIYLLVLYLEFFGFCSRC
jgi:hypothetical protein